MTIESEAERLASEAGDFFGLAWRSQAAKDRWMAYASERVFDGTRPLGPDKVDKLNYRRTHEPKAKSKCRPSRKL